MKLEKFNCLEYRKWLLDNVEEFSLDYLIERRDFYTEKLNNYEQKHEVTTSKFIKQDLEAEMFYAGVNSITFKRAAEKKKELLKNIIDLEEVGEEGQYKFVL